MCEARRKLHDMLDPATIKLKKQLFKQIILPAQAVKLEDL